MTEEYFWCMFAQAYMSAHLTIYPNNPPERTSIDASNYADAMLEQYRRRFRKSWTAESAEVKIYDVKASGGNG